MLSYQEFFKAATGMPPFPYQSRFALDKELPLLVDIPTGMGKTAAIILAWLWRYHVGAAAVTPAADGSAQTPRRLIYCLPMRTLVEQTRDEAAGWVSNLLKAGVLDQGTAPGVSLLMGGSLEQEWDLRPEHPAIIIGTQDQLLSRAMNRGYAMSRYRWPLHFGLLNNDCLWVLDEVQLFGAGLPTTAQLQAFREGFATYGPARSVWMSATLDRSWLATVDFRASVASSEPFRLGDADHKSPPIAQRINARKEIRCAATMLNKDTVKVYGDSLAREVLEAHHPGTQTIVVLNRVDRAKAVFSALRKLTAKAGDKADLLLVHSRFRPQERALVMSWLRSELPAAGRIIVSTQAIEAGVDISAQTLFTELAPWSSLVQRFGRCNRRGELDNAKIVWVDLDEKELSTEHLRPYDADDLAAARLKVKAITDAGPASLLPVESTSKHAPVLRRCDLLDLFDTTPDLAGNDIDVSRFIRDAENLDVHAFWRDWDGGGPPPADMPAAAAHELCPVPAYAFRAFVDSLAKGVSAWRWNTLDGVWERVRPDHVIPGREYLLHSTAGGYDVLLGWDRDGKAVVPVVPAAFEAQDAIDVDPACHRNWKTLECHTDMVVSELAAIVDALALSDVPSGELLGAARWHDAGKAHPLFQQFLCGTDATRLQTGIWAKGPSAAARHARPHFRHELASGIAALLNDQPDLVAYLAAAHHGKVRLSIRSLPGETLPPEPGRTFARGVWHGDQLPSGPLGGGTVMPATTIDLEFMELGEGRHGPSWLARTVALRDAIGPFRLAFLEGLIKIADERASGKEASHV